LELIKAVHVNTMYFPSSDIESMHEIKAPVGDARKEAIRYLREKGFFNVNTPDSTLDNEIHPIFAYEQFRDLSTNAYENMKPGLRLASLYLTDPRILQYFWYQMRSNVKAKIIVPKGAIPPIFYKPKDGHENTPPGTKADWHERLTKLCSVMTWKIQAASHLPKDMGLAYCFPFEQMRTAYTRDPRC
jgi:hypothetical protein